MLSTNIIHDCIVWACEQEVSAPKPGNVNSFSDGHNMQAADFINSAHAIAPVMSQPNITVGKMILQAITATRTIVDCNTNLGIVLLFAPLCVAIQHCTKFEQLPKALDKILNNLTIDDAKYCYQAIQLAEPGGMGNSDQHDLADIPQVTLGEAMNTAQTRDSIAAQFCNNFYDVFNLALPSLKKKLNEGQTIEWATTFAYLIILSHLPDTLIRRKHGDKIAGNVRKQADDFLIKTIDNRCLQDFEAELNTWDNELKRNQINPGTSADLTAATLLLFAFEQTFTSTKFHNQKIGSEQDVRSLTTYDFSSENK